MGARGPARHRDSGRPGVWVAWPPREHTQAGMVRGSCMHRRRPRAVCSCMHGPGSLYKKIQNVSLWGSLAPFKSASGKAPGMPRC